VDLHLPDSDRRLIVATERDVFLAIVLKTGEIRLVVADEQAYPGHIDWIHRDRIDRSTVLAAFSFIVKSGQVCGLFSSSQLNQTSDFRLPDSLLQAALELLPISSEFRLY
jgi:hypothetical protein